MLIDQMCLYFGIYGIYYIFIIYSSLSISVLNTLVTLAMVQHNKFCFGITLKELVI